MIPDHEPEVADRRLQWALSQDIAATSLFHFNETGINVVIAAGQPDPAVVICVIRSDQSVRDEIHGQIR